MREGGDDGDDDDDDDVYMLGNLCGPLCHAVNRKYNPLN